VIKSKFVGWVTSRLFLDSLPELPNMDKPELKSKLFSELKVLRKISIF